MSAGGAAGPNRLVRLAARLVPGHRRAAWLRQWEAELAYREARTSSGAMWRFALGAIRHAAALRRDEMTVRGSLADVRHTLRGFVRAPGFTVVTVLTLALGIGSATAVFSIVETLMLRPVPLPGGDRLVAVYSSNPSRGMGRFSVSYPDFRDFAERTDLLASASFYTPRPRDVSGEGDPERVRTAEVYSGFFSVLGSTARLGRLLDDADHSVAADPTVVLSEALWIRRFGGDPAVLGTNIRIDGVPHTVVGVVASGHGWPREAQLWIPMQWGGGVPAYADSRSNHTWQVVGRLADGVDAGVASDQVNELARSIYSAPDVNRQDVGIGAVVVPLHQAASGDETPGILVVMGTAVFLVLLIACLNASGLLLTRAWHRSRELSLRAALGAGRTRIVATLVGESVVLAVLGGALGIGLAMVGLRRLVAALPMAGPDLTGVGLNPRVALAGLTICLMAGIVAGLLPALRLARTAVADILKDGGTSSGTGRGRARLHRGLVVAELSLSLALLMSAALTVRAFQSQLSADPGFEPEGLLTFTVRLPASRYEAPDVVNAYFREAAGEMRRLPGIESVTSASRLPLGAGGFGLFRAFVIDGAPRPPDGPEYGAAWVEIDPDYFATLGAPLEEGRDFTDDDVDGAPPVAIVNRSMARAMSVEGDLRGREITSIYDENVPRRVVGIAGDIQFDGLAREEGRPVVFVPRAQSVRRAMGFLVRVSGEPSDAASSVRSVLGGVDADVALDGMTTLREAHAADLAGVRFLTVLFGAFGLGALMLAVSGVYGLVAFGVSQRTREIGLRMAVGASRATVLRSLLQEGLRLAAIGIAIGAVLAWGLSRLLAAAFFGLARVEPSTFLVTTAVLVLAVLGASLVPATAATRVNPVEALRAD